MKKMSKYHAERCLFMFIHPLTWVLYIYDDKNDLIKAKTFITKGIRNVESQMISHDNKNVIGNIEPIFCAAQQCEIFG